MTPEQFEKLLDRVVASLSKVAHPEKDGFSNPKDFEKTALVALEKAVKESDAGIDVGETFHHDAFPDLLANGFGVEIKLTTKDSWRVAGNSIFEGMRDQKAERIYVIFGKMGGRPEVRWARYEDCITHVRISHAPRFVVDMDQKKSTLFEEIGIVYDDFKTMSQEEKMRCVREYHRKNLGEGERLWWFGEEREHTLPIKTRLYRLLDKEEKRRYRAEAAILNPQVCKSGRAKGKYDDAARYLLMEHGVFCSQARDLFSAGSVAGKERGGNYLLRALQDIQDLMRSTARELDAELFLEYWNEECPADQRIKRWLQKADGYAKDWRPSEHLFLGGK
uniref:Restriction endonuclease n=1 Tax=Candidatus Kentrum sp. TC TaxID=2126339 RepID=A0A450ZSJ9_9GAMM|nr:MAG: hypothetical protein BECKTC1821F_GA0114240_101220 [Candidatus Kentron sp. TC]